MADWAYLPDPHTGCNYYANLATGETSWERPKCLDAQQTAGTSHAPAASGGNRRVSTRAKKPEAKWVEYMDEVNNMPYYYNEVTGESAWFIPAVRARCHTRGLISCTLATPFLYYVV